MSRINTSFLISIIIGFIAGLILSFRSLAASFNHIILNKYISYKMFRLAFMSLRQPLWQWLKLAFLIALSLTGVWILIIFGRRVFFKNSILNMRKNKNEKKLLKATAFSLALLLIIFNIFSVMAFSLDNPRGPNVIVILVDGLRRDHLGLYGYHRNTSPNIDRFSKDAIVFKNTISQCSWTAPSVSTLLSSLYSIVHGLTSYSYSHKNEEVESDKLDYKIVTLAEVMKNMGYKTGAFITNLWVSKHAQFDQGFDIFDEPVDSSISIKGKKWDELSAMPVASASSVNEKALRWVVSLNNRPFFAYLHYMDIHEHKIHSPYDTLFKSKISRLMNEKEARRVESYSAGREKDRNDFNYYIDIYDGTIRYIDDQIGNLFRELKENNLLDTTIIVILADHGEALLDHGYVMHGITSYAEEINVPLIIKFPGKFPIKKTYEYPTELSDVATTILSFLGSGFPYEVDGRDLLKNTDESVLVNRSVFSSVLWKTKLDIPYRIAMIKDNFKAIYNLKEDGITELYDLENDPKERENVVSIYPVKISAFSREIEDWIEKKLRKRESLGIKKTSIRIKDKERIQRLRSLGYL